MGGGVDVSSGSDGNYGAVTASITFVKLAALSKSAMATGERSGVTNLFIHPGHGGAPFRRVGAMLTNFHLPRTSLLLLVCAFAGTEFAMAAYRHAVEARYRFFSYGDCMLIL